MKRIEIREAFSLPDLSEELDEDREDRSGLGEWLRQCFLVGLRPPRFGYLSASST